MPSERERAQRQLVESVRRVVDSWRDGWIEHDGDVDELYQLEEALRDLDQAELVASIADRAKSGEGV
ncbi:MAG: hypothetical protein WBW04_20250 [Nitrolancea sp.]